MRNHWHNLKAKVLLLFISIVSVLMLAEIALRIAKCSYPNFFTIDERLGVVLRPGTQSWYRREGVAFVRINSEGFRDREHSKQKPENTLRIAVLGDSFTDAWQVPLEKTFCSVMERSLSRCNALGGKKVEVINFGVSGFGTARELIMLGYKVWDYSPDIVILAFFTGNDVRDNSIKLDALDYLPYFVYKNEKLVLDNSFIESRWYKTRKTPLAKILYKIIDSSRIVQLIKEVNNIKKNSAIAKQHQKIAGDLLKKDIGLDNMVYYEPKDTVWKEAWQITEDLLIMMRDEVQNKGAYFLVVTLSNDIQTDPDPMVRERFMQRLGIQDLFYPDKRIKSLGERENFPVLNLAPLLQDYAQRRKVCLHGFKNSSIGTGHWNIDGHRLTGEIIADEICKHFINKPYVKN